MKAGTSGCLCSKEILRDSGPYCPSVSSLWPSSSRYKMAARAPAVTSAFEAAGWRQGTGGRTEPACPPQHLSMSPWPELDHSAAREAGKRGLYPGQLCAQLRARDFVIKAEQENGSRRMCCHRTAGAWLPPDPPPLCHQGEWLPRGDSMQVSLNSLEIRSGLWSWELEWGN